MRKWITLIAVLMAGLLAACDGGGNDGEMMRYEDLPATGDPVRGAELFTQSINRMPTCISCHAVEGEGGAASPSLAGYGAIAGERVPDMSAREYSFWAIVDVRRFTTPGYNNVMYDGYGRLSPQDIADLIAYMLEL